MRMGVCFPGRDVRVMRSPVRTLLSAVAVALVAAATCPAVSSLEIEGLLKKKYPELQGEVDSFLLMYMTDEAEQFEKEMGELAVKASADVGDYKSLYQFQKEGRARVQRAQTMLGREGVWKDYWRKLPKSTRDVLLQNPGRMGTFLDILDSLGRRPDRDTVVRPLLLRRPMLPVVLHVLPSLAAASSENLEKLLPFLLGVDYGGPEGLLKRLDGMLAARSQTIIELLEKREGGAGAVITVWAAEDIFNEKGTLVSTWLAVAAQAKFITRLHAQTPPEQWPVKAALVRECLNAQTLNIRNESVLLVLTLNPGGELLEGMYLAKEGGAESDFGLMLEFFDFCLDWDLPMLPGTVFWETANLAPERRTAERRVMMEVTADKRFVGPLQAKAREKMQGRGTLRGQGAEVGIPMSALAVMQFAGDPNFRQLLARHRAPLVLYLYRQGHPEEALKMAMVTDLKDLAWDESVLKRGMSMLPGGEIMNVCFKMWNSYPIERREWVNAAIDAADMLSSVLTAGLSAGATAGASMTLQQATQKVTEMTITKALKESIRFSLTKAVERENVADATAVNVGDRDHDDDAAQARRDRLMQWAAAEFEVPYRAPWEHKATWMRGRQSMNYAMPAGASEMREAIRRNDATILLVTLAEYQKGRQENHETPVPK